MKRIRRLFAGLMVLMAVATGCGLAHHQTAAQRAGSRELTRLLNQRYPDDFFRSYQAAISLNHQGTAGTITITSKTSRQAPPIRYWAQKTDHSWRVGCRNTRGQVVDLDQNDALGQYFSDHDSCPPPATVDSF